MDVAISTVHEGDPSLSGNLEMTPFRGEVWPQTVRSQLNELVAEASGPEIVVITRFPAGVQQVEEALNGDPTTDDQTLSIETLSSHALLDINEIYDDIEWLSPSAENALLVEHANQYEWETDFLKSASQKESFHSDLRAFVAQALQYPRFPESTGVVGELFDFTESFYNLTLQNNYLPREGAVRTVVRRFQKDGPKIDSLPDAVLAVQFEEYTSLDRLYLAYITQSVPLRAVGRKHASIFRTRFESATIGEQTTLTVSEKQNKVGPKQPEAVAEWLACGGTLEDSSIGTLGRVHGETYDEHIRAIGTGIQKLKRHGIAYDEIAVAFPDASSPIGDAVDILWNMGIPVSSTVANGLEHDPAVRELYTVVEFLSTLDHTVAESAKYRSRLKTRLQETAPIEDPSAVVDRLFRRLPEEGYEHTLAIWINETQLKHRIAEDGAALQQRLTFQHIDHILDIARFFDRTATIDTSWSRFRDALEFESDYKASEQVAAELESQEVGVTVDTVGSARGANFDTVFIASAVDEAYPGDPMVNRLVPTTRLPHIDHFPQAVPSDIETVMKTFDTPEPPTEDPFKAYTQALSRRMLAEAAGLAERRLYFGTYEASGGRVGKRVQPSRFLQAITERTNELSVSSEKMTVKTPEKAAVDTVDERRRDIRLDSTSLPERDQLEAEFGAIRTILDADTEEALRQALESRKDWGRKVIGDE